MGRRTRNETESQRERERDRDRNTDSRKKHVSGASHFAQKSDPVRTQHIIAKESTEFEGVVSGCAAWFFQGHATRAMQRPTCRMKP